MQEKIKKEICQRWVEIDKISEDLCHDNCRWYHGSWCLLRCLDMVTGAFLFYKFYKMNIDALDIQKIAVVGTAGISTPYLMSKLKPKAEIDVIDICPTPLKACEIYAKENGLNWKFIQQDMLKEFEAKNRYDLVVNDAFLTLFKSSDKIVMLKNIHKLLNDDGYYITTLRKGSHPNEVYMASVSTRDKFIERAVSRSESVYSKYRDIVRTKAEIYTSTMTNYPIDTIANVCELFECVGFKIVSIDEIEIFGENEYTVYFQVVAQKIEKV